MQFNPTVADVCTHQLLSLSLHCCSIDFFNILLDEIKNLKCQLLIAAAAGIEDTGNSPAFPLFFPNQ